MKGLSLTITMTLLGIAIAPPPAEAKPVTLRPAAVVAQHSRYQDAEAVWKRISIRNPGNAKAYYNLGITQANQQKWQEAVDSYQQAIAIEPNFVHAYCNLGRAQAKLEQYQAAAQSYRHALSLNPRESLAEEMLNELKIIARGNGIDLALVLEQS